MTNFDLIKKAAMDLRAVNNKFRRNIIELLAANKELTVTEIYIKLRWEQSVASQHLAIMRRSNIVSLRRDGKYLRYSLNTDRLKYLENNCHHIVNYPPIK